MAKGAFIYLTKEDALVVPKFIAEKALLLQSKHILASNSLRRIVKMALGAMPELQGREGFLLRRAGAIETEEEWKLPGSSAGPDAQEDGFPSNDLPVEGAGSAASGQDAPSQTDDFGPVKKHNAVRLVQCDPSLMEDDRVKGLDLELLEFLTSPPSVQMLDPDMWMRVWEEVCKENKWIDMRMDQKSGDCPYCTVCGRWAEVSHLLSLKCSTKVTVRGNRQEPLLTAILEAEQKQREQQREHWERVHRPPPAEDPAAPQGEAANQNLAAPQGSRANATGGPPQAAHEVGKPFVPYNPESDVERWKKPHGQDCTKHHIPHRPPPPPPPPTPAPPPPPPPPPPSKVDKYSEQADVAECTTQRTDFRHFWEEPSDPGYGRPEHRTWRKEKSYWQEDWPEPWKEKEEWDDVGKYR